MNQGIASALIAGTAIVMAVFALHYRREETLRMLGDDLADALRTEARWALRRTIIRSVAGVVALLGLGAIGYSHIADGVALVANAAPGTTTTRANDIAGPGVDSVLYPNKPAGVGTEIFTFAGDTINTPDEPLMLYPSAGLWNAQAVTITDATNPTGSGKAIAFVRNSGDRGRSVFTIDSFSTANGGSTPKDTVYIAIRYKLSSNHRNKTKPAGWKFYYFGNARAGRSQGANNPTQFYITREPAASMYYTQQNNVPTSNLFTVPAGTLDADTLYQLIEILAIRESTASADDGYGQMWINGDSVGAAITGWTDTIGAEGFVGFQMIELESADTAVATDTFFLRHLSYWANK